MLEIIFDIILLQAIVCFIVDTSGFVNEMKRLFMINVLKLRNPDPANMTIKPFDCSMCMTFWAGLCWIIFTGHVSLASIVVVCMAALLASNMSELQLLIKDYIAKIECWLQKHTK